jgi:FixJ family two-component response regulator
MEKDRCVFIIDDNSSARNGIARLLRAAGYAVCDFASAGEFLEKINPNISGCLLIDISMPGLLEDELVMELKKCNIELPIIVLTGDDNSETRRRANNINAVGFFRKPVDGIALLDALEWTLRKSLNNN